MPQNQTTWSSHPEQEEAPDSEVCGPERSQRSWPGCDVVPRTGASGSRDPDQAGKEPSSSRGEARHQGVESLDLQAGFGLHQFQELFGSMGQTLHPADRVPSVPGGLQGLDTSANLEMYELESVLLPGMQGMTGFEMRGSVETGGTAGPGSRLESGCRAAAAVAGWAESVLEAWAVPLPAAVLAEGRAGQWAWLGGTESESAAGSSSEVLSYQCQELSASDSSDTATPGPGDTRQRDCTFV